MKFPTISIRNSLLLFIVFLSIALRLYRINYPLLDWHSFRQADTASVTLEYVKNGINIVIPKYHDVSNIQSGKDNPEGYRMVEFPIVNAIVAGFLYVFPEIPLVPASRAFSILFSVGTLLSIFYLTQLLSGTKTAYLASFFFAVLPYSIYYSRVVLPEPAMLFLSTFSLCTFSYWLKYRKIHWWALSAVSLSLALLLKPFVAFLGPVYFALLYREDELLLYKRWVWLVFFGLISFIPLLWWRHWIEQFPSGIPANDWLLNGNQIRFRPAWIRWLGFERLTKLFLGFAGVVFLPLAFIKNLPDRLIYFVWWVSIGLFFTVFATGNVQHDYYQVIMIPIVSITLAKGVLFAFEFLERKSSHFIAFILVSGIISTFLLTSWFLVKGWFNVNHWEYVKAGQAAQERLPEDARVIAPAFGDTAFLFQTQRIGWPIGFEIEDKIQK
ncbi:MAG: glycosyltransferase family 39 protein, partial [Microgenomates group bacterium]